MSDMMHDDGDEFITGLYLIGMPDTSSCKKDGDGGKVLEDDTIMKSCIGTDIPFPKRAPTHPHHKGLSELPSGEERLHEALSYGNIADEARL